jgi:hypothetical protein
MTMTKQLTPAQIKELRVFLADYGLEVKAKPNKGQPKLRSKWYRPITPAQLGAKPYPKWLTFVKAGTEPIKGSECYNSRVPLCQSNWPSDIHAFYAN